MHKKTMTSGALALAMVLTGQAFAYETVMIPTLSPPNIVDGDLSDPCWKKAYASAPFTAIKPGDKITEETRAYLFCTADTLYIGAKCSFTDYALREKIVNDKSKSGFAGDCIELFLDPGDTGNYAHIAINGDATLLNCIVWNNGAKNYDTAAMTYSCSSPKPTGEGNRDSDPQFRSSLSRGLYCIASDSPCAKAGVWQDWMPGLKYLNGVPMPSEPGDVPMGCYAPYQIRGLIMEVR
jgi:hypothetical protein